jgi:lipid-A-disaccharide synthase
MTERVIPAEGRDLRLFVVAGEHSGDVLGGRLMAALGQRRRGRIRYLGVGGPHMAAEGLVSQFPMEEVAVMGPAAVLARLPQLLQRIGQTAAAAIAAQADAVLIIDSPEFTHPIARRIRRRAPSIPIIDYVSPSVWAWRPGRARRMRTYVDHVLALLPFEPAAHRRLQGPPCTYVGHQLVERLPWMATLDPQALARRLNLAPDLPVLVVLPGSRTSEVKRLMRPFGDAVARLLQQGRRLEIVLPVVSSVRALVEAALPAWPQRPHLVEREEDKFSAFKLARVALAASGTVSLELAAAGTPMVVGYKVDPLLAAPLRLLVTIDTAILANLVLGERAFPEFLQGKCTPVNLAGALGPLLDGGPARDGQMAALARIPDKLRIEKGSPSEAAADIVLHYAEHGRVWPHPAF